MQTDEIVALTRKGINELLKSRQEQQKSTHDGPERRSTPRWPFPGTVEVWPINGDGSQEWLGMLRDLSPEGVGMKCERPFPHGTVVEIAVHVPEVSFCGQGLVRYCREMDDEYFVGIGFVYPD